MVMRLQLVEGEYRVIVPAEAVQMLKLKDGDQVDLQPLPLEERGVHRTVSLEEGMAAYRAIEPLHRNTMLELAK